MTSSVLGIETKQVKETDPRTGRERVFYLPKTNQQTGTEEKVRLPKSSRLQGTYIIGATGAGKSGLLENLILQDIRQQIGVCVLDPHGDLINNIIGRLSDDQLERVILLDIEDTHFQGTDYYPGLNIYQCDDPTDDDLVTETHGRIEHIFDVVTLENSEEKLGVRVSQGIRNSAYTLIDSSPVYGCTMLELPMLFQEDVVLTKLASHLSLSDEYVKGYWKNYERFDRVEKASRADMVVNKIEGYIINRKLRRIIGQSKTTLNYREIIDCKPGKILLVKLPGDNEGMTELLGKMLIAQLLAAAFSRKTIPLQQRKQFNIYCDEFELYTTDDFTRLLKECRKYGMAVSIAHQSRDFIDLKNKAASLQVANLIVFRIIRKDADEVAGNFDCTQLRTKKTPRRRTKPIFREWDETVWIDNGEALYKEAEARYEALYEARLNKLTQRLAEAEKQERDALARRDGAIEAKSILSSASLGDSDKPSRAYSGSPHAEYRYLLFHPAWYCYKDSWSGIVTVRSYWAQPEIKYPEWSKIKGWTAEKVEKTIAGMLEVKSTSHSDSFEYEYPTVLFGWKTKRVDYTYIEREERYELSETTLTGLQAAMHERMTGAGTIARRILSDLYDELSGIVKPLLQKGVWFKPELKPLPLQGWSEENLLRWPRLAQHPHPAIGEKRTIRGWVHEGAWHVQEFPRAAAWLDEREKALQALCEQREVELRACQERTSSIKLLLNELKLVDQKIRPEIKAQYQTTVHHKEYLGEQPDTETRIRTSHSYSQGSSVTESLNWPGRSESHGTSHSHSASYSPYDIQWYDLVDELDQTPDQKRDEIAGEIANFPDYVARVKIKVKIKDENYQLVEYTIRTLKPEPGLSDRALEERILQIKAAMIRQSIIRPKHVIDEEITKRQQVLRLPPREPPHKQEAPPPEEEPPISRRRRD